MKHTFNEYFLALILAMRVAWQMYMLEYMGYYHYKYEICGICENILMQTYY